MASVERQRDVIVGLWIPSTR